MATLVFKIRPTFFLFWVMEHGKRLRNNIYGKRANFELLSLPLVWKTIPSARTTWYKYEFYKRIRSLFCFSRKKVLQENTFTILCFRRKKFYTRIIWLFYVISRKKFYSGIIAHLHIDDHFSHRAIPDCVCTRGWRGTHSTQRGICSRVWNIFLMSLWP